MIYYSYATFDIRKNGCRIAVTISSMLMLYYLDLKAKAFFVFIDRDERRKHRVLIIAYIY